MWIDFNNNGLAPLAGQEAGGPRTQAGYPSYSASHEVGATLTDQTFSTTFSQTGATSVGLQPSWPNITDVRVPQM